MKHCRKCGAEKPLAEFGVQRQGAHGPIYRPRCNECNAEDRREYVAANREKVNEYARQHHAKNRRENVARSRRSSWFRKYGITPQAYAELLGQQYGVCAICHQPETAVRNGAVLHLAVDHDHIDGHVRGLLCHRCNQALGHADDSIDRLKAMIHYLESGD